MEPDNPESLIACIEKIRMEGRESFAGREYVAANYDRDVLALKMLTVVGKVSIKVENGYGCFYREMIS